MVKSIILAAGLPSLGVAPRLPSLGFIYYGFESVHGTTIIPLTGFIDVDATSNNTGMIAGDDVVANGREFKFSGYPFKPMQVENTSLMGERRRL